VVWITLYLVAFGSKVDLRIEVVQRAPQDQSTAPFVQTLAFRHKISVLLFRRLAVSIGRTRTKYAVTRIICRLFRTGVGSCDKNDVPS
jgi:hypothetical protein